MLEVRTGCRLHFGLMELSPHAELRYAGFGLMLERPGWWFRFGDHGDWAGGDMPDEQAAAETRRRIEQVLALPRAATGDMTAGANAFRQEALDADSIDVDNIDAKTVQVLSHLPLHSGLGAGTQLACGIACGRWLLRASDRAIPDFSLTQSTTDSNSSGSSGLSTATAAAAAEVSGWRTIAETLTNLGPIELARLAGRGLRSAVGLQGFLSGGLVLDLGYRASPVDAPANLARSIDTQHCLIPHDWRVVLIEQPRRAAIAGEREARLIGELGRQPNPRAERMLQLAQQALSHAEDFACFTTCVDEYMGWAGELFAPIQGGAYNGSDISSAVAAARAAGLVAVGQSSWGPTVFGFAENPEVADQIAVVLRAQATDGWAVSVVQPARHGALLRWSSAPNRIG